MTWLWMILIFAGLTALSYLILSGKLKKKPTDESPDIEDSFRCPTCGAPATIHGKNWECGWCGDSGNLK